MIDFCVLWFWLKEWFPETRDAIASEYTWCPPFIWGSMNRIKTHLRLQLHPGTHPSTQLVTELLRSSEWTSQLLQYSDTALNLHESLHIAKEMCLSRPIRSQCLELLTILMRILVSGAHLQPADGPGAWLLLLGVGLVKLRVALWVQHKWAWLVRPASPQSGLWLDGLHQQDLVLTRVWKNTCLKI